MKIRTGFVSNSSGSSFALFGAQIDITSLDLKKLILKTKSVCDPKKWNKMLKSYKKYDQAACDIILFIVGDMSLEEISEKYSKSETYGDINWDKLDRNTMDECDIGLHDFVELMDLEVGYGSDECENVVVGVGYNKASKKETRNQFEKRISERIKAIFGNKTKCKYYEGHTSD